MAKKSASRRQKKATSSIGTWQLYWSSLNDRTQHAVSVLLLVVISVGFFAPIHFSSNHLIAGDTVQWRSMANDVLEYQEETGRTALWSTNSFGGMPAFMISYPLIVPQLDLIPGTLRAFIWPSSHLILLFAGMYLLVWTLTRNKLASVFSSISFGLTSYIPVILLAGHNTKFIALAWAPWLLLAFIRVLKKPGMLSGLFFAVAAAVNLRAGHVQITYYVVIICGVWWIMEGFGAYRSSQLKSFGKSTAFLALFSAAALLMLAQPYWAFAEFKPFTIRGAAVGGGAGGLSWEYAMAWSQGAGELLTLIIANAFGGAGGLYWGPKTFTGGPHYFGGLTVVLALYAIVKQRTLPVTILWISSLLMIVFALGENFSFVNKLAFNYIPFFNAIRVPETWLSAVALNVSVLAGFGIATAASCVGSEAVRNGNRSLPDRALVGTFTAFGAIVLVLLLASDLFLDFSRQDEPARIFSQIQAQSPEIDADDPRVAPVIDQEIARRRVERKAVFMNDARRTLFFLGAGFLFLYLMQRRKVLPWLAIAGLIVLVTFDLAGVGRRFINAENLSPADSPEQAVPHFGFDDYLMERARSAGGSGHFRVLSLEDGRPPETNARPSYFYESLGGYSGAKLRSYQDFLDHILFTGDRSRLNPNALVIMNVKYLVGRRGAPGYTLVFQDDERGQAVFENPTIPDRAYFVGASEVIRSPEETWARLGSADFDSRNSVLFSEQTGHTSASLDSTSITEVDLTLHSNREIEWRVKTDAARWLVISEIYYPRGWTASIDDQPVQIYRANYLNRALFVPAGTHRIRMNFDPASHIAGVWISGISTVLVYGMLLLLLVRHFSAARISSVGSVPVTSGGDSPASKQG